MKTKCDSCNKTAFSTKVDAQTYVNAHKDKKLRSYQCPAGNGWHLTSKDRQSPGEERPLKMPEKFIKYLSK